MTGLVCSGCDYLFLPRPWLRSDVSAVQKPAGNRIAALYVRGEVILDGRMIRLPYWHQLVRVANIES